MFWLAVGVVSQLRCLTGLLMRCAEEPAAMYWCQLERPPNCRVNSTLVFALGDEV